MKQIIEKFKNLPVWKKIPRIFYIMVIYLFWLLIVIGFGFFFTLPICYYEGFRHGWNPCILNGLQRYVALVYGTYFNNYYLEIIYQLFYNLIIPSILTYLSYMGIKILIKNE
jgi:hypothetical protein